VKASGAFLTSVVSSWPFRPVVPVLGSHGCMATSRAAARSWIEGFEAAREMERAAVRSPDASRGATIALQLSDVALLTRAPQMRARRDAEDRRARELWCRLKARGVR
jgi:hypothetical protein